jgi:hypothetical protein
MFPGITRYRKVSYLPTKACMHFFRLLLLSSLFALPLLSNAQSDNPVGGHFGLKIGAALSQINITGVNTSIPKRSLQPHIGAMYRYRYHKFVAQPELLIAMKGATFKTPVAGQAEPSITGVNYYYVNVPLLVGYIPTEGLTLQAGPELGYALNAGKTNGPGNRYDVSLAVGAHYDFLDMLNKFSLHVRYVYGFANVSPVAQATYLNRQLQASIVYNLYPKKKK